MEKINERSLERSLEKIIRKAISLQVSVWLSISTQHLLLYTMTMQTTSTQANTQAASTQARTQAKTQASTQNWGIAILRVGLGLMLLWFGISEVLDPELWSSYIPEYALALAPAVTLVYVNAAFEILFGAALVLGVFVRIAALFSGLHIALIALHLGYNEIAIRDAALAAMGIGLSLLPLDRFTLKRLVKRGSSLNSLKE